MDKAKEIITEMGVQYNKESQEFINIDNIVNWIKGNGVISINEIMALNTFIFDYIIYAYDGELPKYFVGYSDNMGQLLQLYTSILRTNLYANIKEDAPKMVVPEIEEVSDEEINLILNTPELKQEVEVRLSFFKTHIKIINN